MLGFWWWWLWRWGEDRPEPLETQLYGALSSVHHFPPDFSFHYPDRSRKKLRINITQRHSLNFAISETKRSRYQPDWVILECFIFFKVKFKTKPSEREPNRIIKTAYVFNLLIDYRHIFQRKCKLNWTFRMLLTNSATVVTFKHVNLPRTKRQQYKTELTFNKKYKDARIIVNVKHFI